MKTTLFLLYLLYTCFGQQTPEGEYEIAPSPAFLAPDFPVTYLGPPFPSQVDPDLIGPQLLLKSGSVNLEEGTITLPLYQGNLQSDTSYNIWYIMTDSSDRENAENLGLNYAPKLLFTEAWRSAISSGGVLQFASGTVDFSKVREVVPGNAPNYYPPSRATAGSVGDNNYVPLVRIDNAGDIVWNAPIIAGNVNESYLNQFCDGIPENMAADAYNNIHDNVVSICPRENQVTLKLTLGFSVARPILYFCMDSNNETMAAIEGATYAPSLSNITVGRDDALFSAIERIFVIINGYTNGGKVLLCVHTVVNQTMHPLRQGLNSMLRGDGSALNVLTGVPTIATDYSPLWDVNLGEWTPLAIENGYRTRLLEEFQLLGFVVRGHLTGPSGTQFGATGIIINCPVAYRVI